MYHFLSESHGHVLAGHRQSLRNWGKSTQTLFCISIKPYFRVRKSYLKALRNDKGKMVRPWVELEKHHYKQLKELQENTGKAISEMIREAVSEFVRKKDYSISTRSSYLPKASRDSYRTTTAYFARAEWDLLVRISQNTGRCKTELVREAVEEYLRKSPQIEG